jgi:hypothetical protein
LGAASFDALVQKVRTAAPEMLALNCNYNGPVDLTIEGKRNETLD